MKQAILILAALLPAMSANAVSANAMSANAVSANAMTLTSAEFKPGAAAGQAQLFKTCGGANLSPGLSWSGAPAGTTSYALTLIDASVKPSGFSHWIVLNIPAKVTHLAQGAHLPSGARGIISNMGGHAYAGPCPPAGGGTHSYTLTVYALGRRPPAIAADTYADAVGFILSSIALAKASITVTATRH